MSEVLMRLFKCPEQDLLLEYHSIRQEIPLFKRTCLHVHLTSCAPCRQRVERIESMWKAYFKPEPDITSSLLSVYSKLQTDETLILKGWKLGEAKRKKNWGGVLFQEGWLFRGAISFGVFALLGLAVFSQLTTETPVQPLVAQSKAPLAQIRVEDKNTLKVHYLEPQLLQTIEFETTRGSR